MKMQESNEAHKHADSAVLMSDSAIDQTVPLLSHSSHDSNAAHDSEKHSDSCSEIWRLWQLAGPLLFQNVMGYSLSVISVAFVGHLGDSELLSSVVLASSFYNVTGYSLMIGLAAGLETICGQAFGAGNYHLMGLALQRATLINFAVCLPIILLWSQSSWVLTLLHQPPEVVIGASRYISIVWPALLSSALSSTLYKYLLAQRKVTMPTICTAVEATLAPIYNYLLIYKYNMGLDGAAYAFVFANATYLLLLLLCTIVYEIRALGTPQQTWPGISMACLSEWWQYLSYGVPAAAQICLEWWMFEVVIFMAGLLSNGDAAVGVMGIMFNICCLCYMLPMAIASAANTRMANALGAGDASAAQRVMSVGKLWVGTQQVLLVSLVYFLRGPIVDIFSTSDVVKSLCLVAIPPLAATLLGDGWNCIMGAALRSCGHQGTGALVSLVGYWAIGCPLCLIFGFYFQLDVQGFWIGLAIAANLQAVILYVFVARIDWEHEVERARELTDQSSLPT